MNFLSAKYNVAARYENYIYEYRRMNASCTVKCHCKETRSGTEKGCSHKLKSGHPAWCAVSEKLPYFSHSKDQLEARSERSGN